MSEEEEQVSWVVMRDGGRAFCKRCGGEDNLPEALPFKAYAAWLDFVLEKHRFCVAKNSEVKK